MYNEFAPKHYKGKWPCTTKTLYNEKTLTGRLHKYFLIYFETFFAPTADTLFLLVLSILTLESLFPMKRSEITISEHTVWSPTFLDVGKFRLMWPLLKKNTVQNACFSAPFSRKTCRFSVPGRKKNH